MEGHGSCWHKRPRVSARERTGFVAHLGSAAPPQQPPQKATLRDGEVNQEGSLTPPEAPPPAGPAGHTKPPPPAIGWGQYDCQSRDVCLSAAILGAPPSHIGLARGNQKPGIVINTSKKKCIELAIIETTKHSRLRVLFIVLT